MNTHIEALLFASDQPLSLKEIQSILTKLVGMELTLEELEKRLEEIQQKYHEGDFAFEVVPLAGGFQFLTKPDYFNTVAELLKNKMNRKLSTNALETLSVIAYKQPVTKTEIEQIRGVNCDYTIQKLLEKELIVIAGRSEGVGRSLLYATSPSFMNYFGLNSVADLPKLRDLAQLQENEVGTPADLEIVEMGPEPAESLPDTPMPAPDAEGNEQEES